MSHTEEEPSECERGNPRLKKKIKVEGASSLSWVDPLYAEKPDLLWNRVEPVKKTDFEKKYGLSNQGIPPKRLKIPLHVTEAEIEKLFGQKVSNGYSYSWSEDVEWVRKVERMWMITHQRTQVPNTRLINAAEAKGLAYELKKGEKAVNWCVHAEWSCRDQLRRINQERDAAKAGKVPVCEFFEDDADDGGGLSNASGFAGVQGTVSGEHRTPSGVLLEAPVDYRAMAIGEWQEYLGLLEREAPTLEALVSRLSEEKERAKLELVKVSSQVDYGRSLLSTAQETLAALQADCEMKERHVEGLTSAEPGCTTEIDSAVSELERARRKVESQLGAIEQMKALFLGGTASEGEVAEVKCQEAEQAWGSAVKKQDLWKRHRVALSNQLREMKSAYKRPTLHPAPLPFLYLDCESIHVPVFSLEIPPCPFCTRGFEPAWDCRLSSCRHPYHTWCAYTHFSSNTKCMFEGCNSEQHRDWWIMAGITKPEVDNGGAQLDPWDICKSQNVGRGFEGTNCGPQ